MFLDSNILCDLKILPRSSKSNRFLHLCQNDISMFDQNPRVIVSDSVRAMLFYLDNDIENGTKITKIYSGFLPIPILHYTKLGLNPFIYLGDRLETNCFWSKYDILNIVRGSFNKFVDKCNNFVTRWNCDFIFKPSLKIYICNPFWELETSSCMRLCSTVTVATAITSAFDVRQSLKLLLY